MALIIRKMKRKDIKSVQSIAMTTWHATYDEIIPRHVQDDFLHIAYSDVMMGKRVKKSSVFVAEISKDIVGFAQFTDPDEQGKVGLVALYIHPGHQGKGIGTAFLNEGIRQFENINELYLNVERDNKLGRRFYEAKGFEVVLQYEENLGGHTLNTVKMRLKINGFIL